MCEQASRRLKDAEGERAGRSKAQACAAAELEGVRGELAAAHEAVRELEQAEAKLEGELQAVVKRAEEAEGRMSEVAGHLSALRADVSRGMAAVGERMALLDGECAALERGLRAMEAEREQVRIWAVLSVLCGQECCDLTRRTFPSMRRRRPGGWRRSVQSGAGLWKHKVWTAVSWLGCAGLVGVESRHEKQPAC